METEFSNKQQTKHTPGPWHFIEVGPLRKDGPRSLLLANKTPFVHGTCEGLTDADCKLIAASPEMLTLLQSLVSLEFSTSDENYTQVCALLDAANELINKVEGN